MLLTIGQALERAKEDDLTIRMHIGGEWITGRVLNSDGYGVAVLEHTGEVCVVRLETVSCVRLPGRLNEHHVPANQQGIVIEQNLALERR